ncbi:MAG: hypothetical protein JWP16_1964 [Alphaproteobacteria bacterium]|nr:hypothetical protein [Alphaproteobacteria bacterium]MDB5740924.1 hypothetical protein [Alphaproteobacteria bacterium]
MPAVPLHEGHEVNKDRQRAENEREGDVSFAAFPERATFIIAHDPSAMESDRAGSPISFSTIRAANSAVM